MVNLNHSVPKSSDANYGKAGTTFLSENKPGEMLISNPDLINSCRVCRSPNQDGDYECLYEIANELTMIPPPLTESGRLYENLFTELLPESYNYYPRYLCNSCGLQMKLFRKLREKALSTLQYLSTLYDEGLLALGDEEKFSIPQEEEKQERAFLENQHLEMVNNTHGTTEMDNTPHYMVPQATDMSMAGVLILPMTASEENHSNDMENILETNQINVPEPEQDQITIDQEDIENCVALDKSDYVMEIYKVIDDNTQQSEDLNEEEDEGTMDNDTIGTASENFDAETVDSLDNFTIEEINSQLSCSDEQYVDIESFVTSERSVESCQTQVKRKSIASRRTLSISNQHLKVYNCTECSEIFTEHEDYKYHSTYIHAQTYACKLCDTVLKSARSLASHMKKHTDTPAYQCEICQRTFNQKVHYQYHMNRHNNIRNFKCDQCDKSFLAKADLKVHQRQHTGDRPHVCEICGNSYMMAEHLRTHILKHMNVQFSCELCPQKFANPKTLRQHVTTIHVSEPRFKCEFCSKPFRRKHHLQYHMKLHPQNILKDPNYMADHGSRVNDNLILSEQDVDNPDECGNNNEQSDDENDIIQDSGFVALNDEAMLM
ncbi:zinc finger protein 184 [Musca domestica]|uniref:Zinc finger protein 184 n=1 Tax=Musca domestica TaxID=7370 RepID=A0A9J7CHJ9_MUSDO|nr:zinc finger protein 184 [Musca domestica]